MRRRPTTPTAAAMRRRFLQHMASCLLAAIPAAHAQSPVDRVFEIRIEAGRIVDGRETLRVIQGDLVELRWRADEPIEVHLHGYELRATVAPGAPGLLLFEARATGRFPVTRHAADGHGHETLLHLEVYPR